MKKEMVDLIVETNDSCIVIYHPVAGSEFCVHVPPEQADILIEWIKEAKNELLNKSI